MKKIILAALFVCGNAIAQNPGYELLKKINGVEVYYKMRKTKESDKKDTWLIEFEYFNITGKDIFYKTSLQENKKSFGDILMNSIDKEDSKTQVSNFASILIENTKALDFVSDTESNITGDKTRLSTNQGEALYIIKKGKTYTRSMDFKGKKGITPVIAISIVNSISFTENLFEFL